MKTWYLGKGYETPWVKYEPQRLEAEKTEDGDTVYIMRPTFKGGMVMVVDETEMKSKPSWFRCEIDGWRLPDDMPEHNQLIWVVYEHREPEMGMFDIHNDNGFMTVYGQGFKPLYQKGVKYWKPIEKPSAPEI